MHTDLINQKYSELSIQRKYDERERANLNLKLGQKNNGLNFSRKPPLNNSKISNEFNIPLKKSKQEMNASSNNPMKRQYDSFSTHRSVFNKTYHKPDIARNIPNDIERKQYMSYEKYLDQYNQHIRSKSACSKKEENASKIINTNIYNTDTFDKIKDKNKNEQIFLSPNASGNIKDQQNNSNKAHLENGIKDLNNNNPITHSRYYSNNIPNRTKDHGLQNGNIGLVLKTKDNKKEIISVRSSMQPHRQQQATHNKDDTQTMPFKDNKVKKRNPSINYMIKEKEIELPELDKKRSRSENCTTRNKDPFASLKKDIISFIRSNESKLPNFEDSKVSIKKYGPIEAFVVNTHRGRVRNYNEDRISVLLNAQNKFTKAKYNADSHISCSMFSVLDGHGGSYCCNYLKSNLHNIILEHIDMRKPVNSNIKEVYKKLDEEYTSMALKANQKFSGSCANTVAIINNSLIVINTGDSRTILSLSNGSNIVEGSSDHKPDSLSEFYRILAKGGELYNMSVNVKTGQNNFYFAKNYTQLQQIKNFQKYAENLRFGPWRVKPGGLSVSRSFGDITSKATKDGQSNEIISAEPDIFEFGLKNVDFAFMACKLIS